MNTPETIDVPAIREESPAYTPTLFGSRDPSDVIERASGVAKALANVIEQQKLFSEIQGRRHVRVEGWTLLGSMLGVFPVLVWCRQMEDGWEARVEARTRSGEVVGAAEAQCLRAERNWKDRDDFALRSMAQTRATSKALRLPLGFVVTMAGYDATPYEEMPHPVAGRPPSTQSRPGTPSRSASNPTITEKQQKRLHAILNETAKRIDMPPQDLQQEVKGWMTEMGFQSTKDLTREPYDKICSRLESMGTDDVEDVL